MESSIARNQEGERRKAEIRRKIAALQAELGETPQCSSESSPPRRKPGEQNILAPATPSPKKRKLNNGRPAGQSSQRPLPSLTPQLSAGSSRSHKVTDSSVMKPKEQPSTVLAKLAKFAKTPKEDDQPTAQRTSSFAEKPTHSAGVDHESFGHNDAPKRDENMRIIEDLDMGPTEHVAPFDDPHFKRLEPYSGIRLASRILPHEDFQDYLRARCYISPSKLYSVVRLLPNKQGYDVPVEGDWVTIAVVAERGPVRTSRAPVGVGREDRDQFSDKEDTLDDLSFASNKDNRPKPETAAWKGKQKAESNPKPTGRKYVNLKLIDFGCRSDRVEDATDENGRKRKFYRGGSKGAFEKMSKLREGAVVAFLNPRILKPFQRTGDAPHPRDNILAITPESLESTVVIGYSQDLGTCKATKRDGNPCGSWCDKRVSDVCEYHIQHAVERRRASRPEFSMGTSGMSTGPSKKKPAYDPSRKWGLKPENEIGEGGGATYVVAGHVVTGGPKAMFIGESLGRDAQAKSARKLSAKDADSALQRLLKRDKGGMKAVLIAKEHRKKSSAAKTENGNPKKGKEAEPRKRTREASDSEDEDSDGDLSDKAGSNTPKTTKGYSTTLIRSLGFDPAAKDGPKTKDSDVQKKLGALAAAQARRGEIHLGPRPGKKQTSVRAPDYARSETTPSTSTTQRKKPRFSLSSSDSESDQHEVPGKKDTDLKMIDLDSSDSE